MIDNECSYNRLAVKAGVFQNSIHAALIGSDATTKKTIDAILGVICMTYEVAFALDTVEGDSHA